jgi:hypothetical protein
MFSTGCQTTHPSTEEIYIPSLSIITPIPPQLEIIEQWPDVSTLSEKNLILLEKVLAIYNRNMNALAGYAKKIFIRYNDITL